MSNWYRKWADSLAEANSTKLAESAQSTGPSLLRSLNETILEAKSPVLLAKSAGEKLARAAQVDDTLENKDPVELVRAIMAVDPTRGEWTGYLIQLYMLYDYKFADLPRVKQLLDTFMQMRDNLQDQHLGSYYSLQDLAKELRKAGAQ